MKFSIEGFSQEQLLEHSLDLRDALFLRWFADFQQTDQMRALVDGEVTYYWLQYSYIIDQIPILGLKSADTIRHYLRRLTEAGVLHKKTKANTTGRGSRAYYSIDSAIWRDLTERHDHRTGESVGQEDHRIEQSGGDDDQRTTESGGREDQRTVESGDQPDHRIGETAAQDDHRTVESGRIPPSALIHPTGGGISDPAAHASPEPPPPEKVEEEDPIKKLSRYIAHYVPAFTLSDQATIRFIRQFVQRYGTEELEKVARSYVQEKKGRLVTKYFVTDFPERLGDAMRTIDHAATKPCGKCKRQTPVGILVDGWIKDLLICPECAAKEKARLTQEKHAS